MKMRYELPKVKDTVRETLEPKPLDEITKKDMTLMEYIVVLSAMYGIGSGIGIIAGTAKEMLPDRNIKPKTFYLCLALLFLGGTRGYQTALRSHRLKEMLEQDILSLDNKKKS